MDGEFCPIYCTAESLDALRGSHRREVVNPSGRSTLRTGPCPMLPPPQRVGSSWPCSRQSNPARNDFGSLVRTPGVKQHRTHKPASSPHSSVSLNYAIGLDRRTGEFFFGRLYLWPRDGCEYRWRIAPRSNKQY